MRWSFIQIVFSHVHWFPSSLSDSLVEVMAADDRMKKDAVILNKRQIPLDFNIVENN